MARPIRNTPALYGEDAERFLAEIEQIPAPEVRERERANIQQSVKEFLEIIKNKKASLSK